MDTASKLQPVETTHLLASHLYSTDVADVPAFWNQEPGKRKTQQKDASMAGKTSFHCLFINSSVQTEDGDGRESDTSGFFAAFDAA